MQPTASEKLCTLVVSDDDITNPAVRIGAWIVGAAKVRGGFPLEVTVREIQDGFSHQGAKVAGTGCHHNTISQCLEWLSERGFLTVKNGRTLPGGHVSRIISVI